jgi:hypothetical protein
MCKEMPVILVNRVVVPKRIIGKMEGQGGGGAQEVADPPPQKKTQPVSILDGEVEEADLVLEVALPPDRLEPALGLLVGRDQGGRDGDLNVLGRETRLGEVGSCLLWETFRNLQQ